MGPEPENFKIDTAYNSIDAVYSDGKLNLRSPGNALQSVIDIAHPYRLSLKNLEYLITILLFIEKPKRILMLGTAAGSLLHFLRKTHPLADITALDIDIEMIEMLLTKNILPAADDKLRYVFDDARHFIEHDTGNYDLILVDIFTGAQSPEWLLHKSCSDRLRSLLNPGGGLAYNLLIDSDHTFKQFYRDLRLTFNRQTLCSAVPGFENTIAYAFREQIPLREMSWYMQQGLDLSSQHEINYLEVLSEIYTTNPAGSGVI